MHNNNHAVPHSYYIRWGHHHEWPSGSGRTAPPTAHRTPRIEGPQSSPALASPSSTGCGGRGGEGRFYKDNDYEDSEQLEDKCQSKKWDDGGTDSVGINSGLHKCFSILGLASVSQSLRPFTNTAGLLCVSD